MVAALVGTVYFITRITRNLDHSDLASTGEGEGLEDFMLVRAAVLVLLYMLLPCTCLNTAAAKGSSARVQISMAS